MNARRFLATKYVWETQAYERIVNMQDRAPWITEDDLHPFFA